MNAQMLLDDFNYYRSKTNHFQKLQAEKPYIKLPRLNKERERLLNEMIAWCRSQRIDPRHWLYCLFARQRWLFAPKWLPGALMSESGLKWYREKSQYVNDKLYRDRVYQTASMEQQRAGTSPVYDPALHMSAEAEGRKRRYRQRGDDLGCLTAVSDPDFPTLGWHLQSKFCSGCSRAEECKQKLRGLYPFDVVALRSGVITMEQARLAVAQHGCS